MYRVIVPVLHSAFILAFVAILPRFVAADEDARWITEIRRDVNDVNGPLRVSERLARIAEWPETQRSRLAERMLVDNDLSVAMTGVWLANSGKADGASRTSGFIEGRMQTSIPSWWTMELKKALGPQALDKDSKADRSEKAIQANEAGFELRSYDSSRLSKSDDAMTITCRGESTKIPATKIEEFISSATRLSLFGPYRVSCNKSEKLLFVCVYSDSGYELSAFDTTRGIAQWKSHGWGLGRTFLGGPIDNRLELLNTKDGVAVVGCEILGCYAEFFESDTGKWKGGFSSRLWNATLMR